LYDLWKKDLQSKNALEIIKKGEELFEKIVSFVNNFEKLGNYIQNSQNQYITLFNQLKEGKGNLIQKANALKDLGLKSNKNI
jgi:DNA recombination protein RmuC